MIRKVALTVLLATFAFPAFAERQAQIGDVDDFLDYQRQVRSKVEGGKYGDFDPKEIDRLDRAQNTLFKLLTGKSSTDDLSEADRREVFNAQQEVQALLAENDSDKMICRREKPVGTRFAKTICKTQAQRDLEAESASSAMQGNARGNARGPRGN